LTDWDVYIEQYGSGFLVVYLDVAGFTQIKMWFSEIVRLYWESLVLKLIFVLFDIQHFCLDVCYRNPQTDGETEEEKPVSIFLSLTVSFI